MSAEKIKDPYALRESQKYNNPIPSREYILSLLQGRKKPIQQKELMILLGIDKKMQQKDALRKRLKAMQREGQVMYSEKRGKEGYTLTKNMTTVTGKVMGSREGFGFLSTEDGSPDIFLSAYQMRGVFPEDRILVRLIGEDRRGKREGVIVEILERNTKMILGIYCKTEKKEPTVVPSNPRIHHVINIQLTETLLPKDQQVVLVEILQQPSFDAVPVGIIKKILGHLDSVEISTAIAMYNHRLSEKWPTEVIETLQYLEKQKNEVVDNARVDLRSFPFVTIDGETSQDFDDAVYCKSDKGKFTLWVAIADVSYYVKPNTALDKEALVRGNSVYFHDKVIPMLPEVLSNDKCSLKPNVDRHCLVCEMVVSRAGQLKEYKFYPGLIRSQARLTYTKANQYLLQNSKKTKDAVINNLQTLEKVYQALASAREKRGAIDFDMKESQILVGDKGKIQDITAKNRTLTHCIIEECMLIANVSAARFLLSRGKLGLFRVHELPKKEKLSDFIRFISHLNLPFSLPKLSKSVEYTRFLKKAQSYVGSYLIRIMLLRTMSQAIYSPNNKGHFGLAYKEYTHFTSPIRRYPDLIVHRAIYHALGYNESEENFPYQVDDLTHIGKHCSMTERRADEATREVTQAVKCRFMSRYIGKTFHGVISNVTGFGLFIELSDKPVEGLIHISDISGDYYSFDAQSMMLEGRSHGNHYRLGDSIKVKLASINLITNEMRFLITT